MAGKILQIRSLVPGKVPLTSSLLEGEIAINVPDGKAYLRKSGSAGDVIASFVTTDSLTTGSINLYGDFTTDSGSININSSSFYVNTGSIHVRNDYSGTNIFGTASWALNAVNGGSVTIVSASVPPSTSVSGTLWYNTLSSSLYVQISDPTGSNWVPASPSSVMATGSVTASVDQTKGFTVTSLISGSTFSGSIKTISGSLTVESSSINIISGSIYVNNDYSGSNIFGTASWAENVLNGAPSTIISGSNPPSTSVSGSLWWNTTNGNLYVQISDPTGSTWVSTNTLMSTGSVTASIDVNKGFLVNSVPSGSTFSGSINIISGSIYMMDSGSGISGSGVTIYGTASHAVSASIAYTTVVQAGASKIATITTASLTWSLTHNLGTLYPNVDIYNYNNNIIIPRTIRSVDVNTTEVTFTTPMSGTVVTTVGGGMPPLSSSYANYVLQVDGNGLSAAWKSSATISASIQYAETSSYSTGLTVANGTASAQFAVFGTSSFSGPVTVNGNFINGVYRTAFTSPLDTWSLNHNISSSNVMVQAFNTDGELFFPEKIRVVDINNIEIIVGIPKTGYVIVK